MRLLTRLSDMRCLSLYAAIGTVLGTALMLAACGGSDGEFPPPVVAAPPAVLSINVLSSRPDTVTGNSVLVDIAVPAGLTAGGIKLTANGTDVTLLLAASADGKRLRGLVTGLSLGANTLVADVAGNKAHGELNLVNYQRTGPVFSGPHRTPFECRTEQSGLGAPLDAECSVATRYDWFYFTADGTRKVLLDPLGARPADVATTTTIDGKTVPFIVRVESATLNRSIVRIAVLDDPRVAGVLNATGWNNRVVFRFGESTAAQYNQGSNSVTDAVRNTDVQNFESLKRGFAYVVSTLNINKVNVDDVLSAETVMMVREHVTKTYGVPRWFVGMGGSGGAIQQMEIAQNYPGLLDGVMPDAAFPDVFSTALAVSDCRLLNRYFIANPASDAVRKAFEGHTKGTCASWDAGNGDAVLATSGSINPPCGLLDQSKVYNPVTNPTGARCTVYDINVNSMGRVGFTGAARRPLDNVGIQYGLAALKARTITATQFLDVNAGVGGFDIDGNIVARRTAATADALKLGYETGRINSGSGGLATVPILHLRAYAEPGADIHTIYNDIKIREQLVKANGRADNQVIWLLPNPALATLLGLGTAQQAVLTALTGEVFLNRLTLMTQWLDAIGADPAVLSTEKIARLKPVEAVDSCWGVADARQYKETATLSGAGVCNGLYPRTLPPRVVAGSPITDDVVKCQLKAIDEADYLPVALTSAEKIRLANVFPDGTCDYTKPGVAQSKIKGTWLKY
ncbi:MAG: DUF6351 family protein [Pseudomonadota bacterium]|nr:DUF6351 family protein [Pseudomonadota bacterium]